MKPRKRNAAVHTEIDMAPISSVVGYRLRVAQISVFSDFLATFADMKLKPVDYSILRLVEGNPDIRQGQVATALGIKRANMVGLVNALTRRGLIERYPIADDRRANALRLTRRGITFTRKMQNLWTRHEERVIRRLGGPVEKERLLQLLLRLGEDFSTLSHAPQKARRKG